MDNPNNCSACRWFSDKRGGGHCYMFRDAPDEICYQHTARKEPDVIDLFAAARRQMKPGVEVAFTLVNTNPDGSPGLLGPDEHLGVIIHDTE